MPHQPPENLIELLARLGLATRAQVEGVAGRVRRLAGELPLFESVWVDALCQARLLTPFQAAEINAGRGDRLLVGNYLLSRGLASNGLGQWFVVCQVAPRRNTTRTVVPLSRLFRASCQDQSPDRVLHELQSLIQDLQELAHSGLAVPFDAGTDGDECWVVCPQVEGICAADWLAHNGRLPPAAVLEIARQTAAALAALESRGRLHSDLGARQLVLTTSGDAALPLPGVRAILRPAEGYTRLDLLPEAYDYLAPERISAGTPPDTASELFACGCLWWHLLCGRPPLAGGDALGKVRSAQQARIADVRRFAPEAPQVLVDAIGACTQFDPRRRGRSLAELAERLGPPEKAGRAALVRCLQPPPAPANVRRRSAGTTAPPASSLGSLVGTSLAAIVLVSLGVWWLGRERPALPLTEIRGPASPAAAQTLSMASRPANSAAPADISQNRPPDLVLQDARVRLSKLPLQPGQTVRSAPGRRTLVITPRDGLAIDVEDVRFENLDFAPDANQTAFDTAHQATLLQLRAHRAAFHGCSFQGLPGTASLAIDWAGPPPADGNAQLLPTGLVQLTNCIFHRVDRGLCLRSAGALRLEVANSLCLARQAWVELKHFPRADESCLISLTHCTLRGGRSLVELPSKPVASAGQIHVRANDCAFAPAPDGALLVLAGTQPEEALLRSLRVSGQGSILSPEAPLALWQPEFGPLRPLGEEQIEVAGLVRSPIGFAGPSSDLPAASRVVRWQAPLISSDPPGILEMVDVP